MRLLVILLLLILSTNVIAQESPSDYYITSAADTVYGSIRIRTSDYYEVQFKAEDRSFESLPESVIRCFDSKSQQNYVLKEMISGKKVFLVQEIVGPISVYSSPGRYHLYKSDESSIQVVAKTKLSIPEYAREIDAIKTFLSDCDQSLETEFDELYDDEHELRQKGLNTLINKYNKCIDPEFVAKKSRSFATVDLQLFVGVGQQQIGFQGNNYFSDAGGYENRFMQYSLQGRFGLFSRGRMGLIVGVAKHDLSGDRITTEPSNIQGHHLEYRSHASIVWTEIRLAADYLFRVNKNLKLYPTVGWSSLKTNIRDAEALKTLVRESDGNESGFDRTELSNDILYTEFEPIVFAGAGIAYRLLPRLALNAEFINYFEKTIPTTSTELNIAISNKICGKLGLTFRITRPD